MAPHGVEIITALFLAGFSDARGLDRWYEKVGGPREAEVFGELLARTAQVQVGAPYREPSPSDETPPELVAGAPFPAGDGAPPPSPLGSGLPAAAGGLRALSIDWTGFDCMTLIETSLAVARCAFAEIETAECVTREVQSLRYRSGKRTGYASRLHYLSDWIEDNAQRGHVQLLSSQLGGEAIRYAFDYMSRHPFRYPPLSDARVLTEIREVEKRLSAQVQIVVPRSVVTNATRALRDGDIVAIATKKPGLLLTHAGFVVRGGDGEARFLHASSYHGRVVLTKEGLAQYVLRRTERIGIVVARPLGRRTP